MQKTKFEKEIIELEYRKILSEYNALLIALATVTLGIAGLVYTLIHNMQLSLMGLGFSYFILTLLRQDKSEELNKKVRELRGL